MPPRKKEPVIIETDIDEESGTADVMNFAPPRRKSLTDEQAMFVKRLKTATCLKAQVYDGMQRMLLMTHELNYGFMGFVGPVYYDKHGVDLKTGEQVESLEMANVWIKNHLPLLDMILTIAYMRGCFSAVEIALLYLNEKKELSKYFTLPDTPLPPTAILERQRFAITKYLNSLVLVYDPKTKRYKVKHTDNYEVALRRKRVSTILYQPKSGAVKLNWNRARTSVFQVVEKQAEAVWRTLFSCPAAKGKVPSDILNFCYDNGLAGVMHLLAGFYKVDTEIKPTLKFGVKAEKELWEAAAKENFLKRKLFNYKVQDLPVVRTAFLF